MPSEGPCKTVRIWAFVARLCDFHTPVLAHRTKLPIKHDSSLPDYWQINKEKERKGTFDRYDMIITVFEDVIKIISIDYRSYITIIKELSGSKWTT